jgi:hypothetical protein
MMYEILKKQLPNTIELHLGIFQAKYVLQGSWEGCYGPLGVYSPTWSLSDFDWKVTLYMPVKKPRIFKSHLDQQPSRTITSICNIPEVSTMANEL